MGDLRNLQQLFKETLQKGDPDLLPLSEERIEIYREAYRTRLRRSLREDFPRVARLVGEEFDALASAFIAAFPPCSASLYAYSRDFAYSRTHREVMVSNAARFDWAEKELFLRGDPAISTVGDLTADDTPPRLQLCTNSRLLRDRRGNLRIFWRHAGRARSRTLTSWRATLAENLFFPKTPDELAPLLETTSADPADVQATFHEWTHLGILVLRGDWR